METLSDCWNLKVILKEKTQLYVNSITQMCPNKVIKTFLIEDFFYLPPLSTPPVHSGTEVVLVREGPRAGGGSSQRKKGSDYFTSPVKTMTLRDIK
jgi:hypothetical protein